MATSQPGFCPQQVNLPRGVGLLLLLVGGLLSFARPASAQLYVERDASGRLVVRNHERKRSTSSSAARREVFEPQILEAARRYRLSPELVRAMIHVESDFNPTAVSGSGALGLMQLMPETVRDLGLSDPLDPRQNIFGGCRYLRMLLDRFEQDLDMSLAAYNAGPSTVEAADGVPRIRETREYVRKVRARLAGRDVASTGSGKRRKGRSVRLIRDTRGGLLLTNRP
jgi:soluble lytic murein transglycosylase-like protein